MNLPYYGIMAMLSALLALWVSAEATATTNCSGRPLEATSNVKLGFGFFRAHDRVCFEDTWLRGLDPRKAKVKRHGVITDGRLVFVRDVQVVGADANSFEYVGYRYYRDKTRVYEREGRTFRVLPQYHAKSFTVHGAYYTADKAGVYWNHFWIPSADPKTFVNTSLQTGRDKNRIYLKGVARYP